MANVIGEDRKIVRNLRPLAEFHNYGEACARGWVFAIARGIFNMDCVNNGFINELNSRIRIEVCSQASGDRH